MDKLLEILVLIFAGTLVGNELAIGLFIHPQMSLQDDCTHLSMSKALAKTLGRYMPGWYVVVVFLTIALSVEFYRHDHPGFVAEAIASGIWIVSILLSVVVEVPINNVIANLDPANPPKNWQTLRAKWDRFHGYRNILLLAAFIFLIYGIVAA